jgi:hypothetical protein
MGLLIQLMQGSNNIYAPARKPVIITSQRTGPDTAA